MKKEAPPKHKGLVKKTSDEKKGTSKMQGVRLKGPLMKKRGTPKHEGLVKKTTDEKRGTPKCKGLDYKDLRRKKRHPKTQGVG
jgi:hypothetical protein